jgi:hypothetical protein
MVLVATHHFRGWNCIWFDIYMHIGVPNTALEPTADPHRHLRQSFGFAEPSFGGGSVWSLGDFVPMRCKILQIRVV